MNLILKNLSIQVERKYNQSIIELKKILNLQEFPFIIDCFDISNFGTTYAVGACVRFVNGYPYKRGYRKFKIRTLQSKQDDYSMIKEIVHRKYSSHNIFDGDDKISNKNNINSITNDKIENSFPSLIVIDGGKGQLSAAQIVLKKMSLNIPLISIAKENEDIYTNFSSEPMQISKKNPVLHLLQFVRDEAHRFGLAYNTKLRAINLK